MITAMVIVLILLIVVLGVAGWKGSEGLSPLVAMVAILAVIALMASLEEHFRVVGQCDAYWEVLQADTLQYLRSHPDCKLR